MVKIMTTRLTRTNWLNHGLKTLTTSGAGALKAEPLAKSLNVSRGSFYWHFKDIQQFHQELLAKFEVDNTARIIVEIDQAGPDQDRLKMLLHRAMGAPNGLERAIRGWATENTGAAKTMAAVDKARLKYLSDLLRQAGLPTIHAIARAKFIYWAYIGQVMSDRQPRRLKKEALDAIADLMQSGS